MKIFAEKQNDLENKLENKQKHYALSSLKKPKYT